MAPRVVSDEALVLDSEGLTKLAGGNPRVRAFVAAAWDSQASVVVSAITLTEVLRGGARDAAVHRVLARTIVQPVTPAIARNAGELLGATGLGGHRCAIDAVVAATTLALPRPVTLLTSDPDDLSRLVEEPSRAKEERVRIRHV